MVGGTGFLLTTVIGGGITGAGSYGFTVGLGLRAAAAVVGITLNTALFTYLFTRLTVRQVHWRSTLPRAALAAAGWYVLQLVGTALVAHKLKGAQHTYGTFAVVIGLLSLFHLLRRRSQRRAHRPALAPRAAQLHQHPHHRGRLPRLPHLRRTRALRRHRTRTRPRRLPRPNTNPVSDGDLAAPKRSDTEPRRSPMASTGEQRGKTFSHAAAVRRRSDDVVRRRHPRHLRPLFDDEPVWARDFEDLSYEWRRLFSEFMGTFLLVVVGAGGGVVAQLTHDGIGRAAAVTAPGLMVAAIILFMGAISGAHLNPAVSLAFALRGDFQWRRVPGYVSAQLLGAGAAAVLLRALFGAVGHLGATLPAPQFTSGQAFGTEVLLTFGLVSVILGVSSAAQNVGQFAAIGVGSYIVLAGLWASPVSGASMNPARSAGPALVAGDLHQLWIYLIAPPLGAAAAVGAAWILRGPGGDHTARTAAEGKLG